MPCHRRRRSLDPRCIDSTWTALWTLEPPGLNHFRGFLVKDAVGVHFSGQWAYGAESGRTSEPLARSASSSKRQQAGGPVRRCAAMLNISIREVQRGVALTPHRADAAAAQFHHGRRCAILAHDRPRARHLRCHDRRDARAPRRRAHRVRLGRARRVASGELAQVVQLLGPHAAAVACVDWSRADGALTAGAGDTVAVYADSGVVGARRWRPAGRVPHGEAVRVAGRGRRRAAGCGRRASRSCCGRARRAAGSPWRGRSHGPWR